VQAIYIQLLSKNPICRKQREEYFRERSEDKIWVFFQMMFNFSEEKFSEKLINTFRCSETIYIFTERFHSEKEVEILRTPANIASVFFDQHQETSRRTAVRSLQTNSPPAVLYIQ
jgi:hypothetical protein